MDAWERGQFPVQTAARNPVNVQLDALERDRRRVPRSHTHILPLMGSPASAEALSILEDRYYRRWMSLSGETATRSWSKRRAMFWGLLVTTDVDAAYEAGERVARNIGRPASPKWSSPNKITGWFLRKAAVANLFEIEIDGRRAYRLIARAGDPWAETLRALARALFDGQRDPRLPPNLPERTPRTRHPAEVLGLAQKAFGLDAMPAIADVVHDEVSADAAEFRLAVERGAFDDARYWFEREWSFRAKERYRTQVMAAQHGTCACCGTGDRVLELNHRKKVRDWGRTQPDNLEALCSPCHRSADRFGTRCH